MQTTSGNIEPLLDDKEPTLPRLGAYAPTGETSSLFRKRMSQLPLSEMHDVPKDFAGHVHQPSMVPENEEDDLPPLPPLISYCSYVRFGCAFAKWYMLVGVINLGAYTLCRSKEYLTHYTIIPFDSWVGSVLAGIWLGTAVWAYLSARRYEQYVQDYDRVAQYEQGQQAEDPEDPSMAAFIPNYEHMYGFVSRKIDEWFARPKGGGAQPIYSMTRPPPEGTSSLVNLSFVLWSISFSAAFSLAFGITVGKGYVDLCGSNSTSISASLITKIDYNNLLTYPSGVQDWANVTRLDSSYYDPYGYHYQTNFKDEILYGFPTASTEPGSFAEMQDGTIFFAGLPPPVKQKGGKHYLRIDHMVLVESPGSGKSLIYHDEIVDPRMFIPVESTMTNNSRGDYVAAQFCFTASNQTKEEEYFFATLTTPIFCIISLNSSTYEIRKETITWTDKGRNLQVRAASTGSEVLIAHVGQNYSDMYREVVSISPATMTKQGLFHMTQTEGRRGYGYIYDEETGRMRRPPSCIQQHVQIMSAIAAVVVLVMCSAWLIVREGVSAGVAPFCLAVVILIRMCTSRYSGISTMSLVLGSFVFHCIICCGSACPLPAWFGRELKVWGLYSWILAFYAVGRHDTGIVALIMLGLSGMVLNHPTCKLMGYAMVTHSAFIAVQLSIVRMSETQKYREWDHGGTIRSAFVGFLLGMGVLGLENLVSSNRRYCVALWRPMAQTGRTLVYGSRHASRGGRRR